MCRLRRWATGTDAPGAGCALCIERKRSRIAGLRAVGLNGENPANATAWFGKLLFTTAVNGWNAAAVPEKIRSRSCGQVSASGFYKNTLEAAMWAGANTSTFEDAVNLAVNLGDDADTVGAVTGQLGDAIYGESSIPERWLKPLAWRDEVREMAESLIR